MTPGDILIVPLYFGDHSAVMLRKAIRGLSTQKEKRFETDTISRRKFTAQRTLELLTEALRYGRGRGDLGQLCGALEIEESQGLDREQYMVAMVNRGIGQYGRLGGTREFQPTEHLRDEQKCAVKQILESQDLAINLRGAAGTGKTATLQEIDRGLSEAGRDVSAVAPTRSAVEELQKVGFRDAMTVSRLTRQLRMAYEDAHRKPTSVTSYPFWEGQLYAFHSFEPGYPAIKGTGF